jgi:K+-transporting ATPase ATPase C chain
MNQEGSALQAFGAALRLAAACCAAFGAAYPLVVLGAGRWIAPRTAAGSLIVDDAGVVIGSELLAQAFTEAQWFWPRPSAVGYNASAAGGSNLAPTNPALAERVEKAVQSHRAAGDEVSSDRPLPLDLALASGSGLDPDLTLEAARFQVARVARARGLSEQSVSALVEEHAAGELAARLTGSARTVNVLRLNLALARLAGDRSLAWMP